MRISGMIGKQSRGAFCAIGYVIVAAALILISGGVLTVITGCGSRSKTGTLPPADSGLPRIYVTITNTALDDLEVLAEVATTSEQRATGLMNRASLDPDEGMLFVFDSEDFRSFWMMDTLISLDMIFVNSNKVIVDINHSATPGNLIPYVSASPARYVLEVVGGYCVVNGVNIGDTLRFDGY